MRCTDWKARPVTTALINCYKFLCSDDIRRDPLFRETAIAVATNACRHQIILTRLISDAVAQGSVILSWRNPLTGTNAGRLAENDIEHLYRTHPALTSFFLPGAPCFCLDNWNPAKGLFNGTAAVQHSLVLDPREDVQALYASISAGSPGKFVMLSYPPKYVNVRLSDSHLSRSDSLDAHDIIVPIPQWASPRVEKIKAHEFPHHFPPIRRINYRSPTICLSIPSHSDFLIYILSGPLVSNSLTLSRITRSNLERCPGSSWTCTSGQVLTSTPPSLPSTSLTLFGSSRH